MSGNGNNTNRTKSRVTKRPQGIEGGTREANRLALMILEVLAGERSPGEASKLLGIGTARYYQLEIRALNGLVQALEPRPKGKQPSPESRIAKLERALEGARRQCGRQQTLVRAAQRSLGIKAPSADGGKRPSKDRAGRRKRRPTVRALKAARALAADTGAEEVEPLQHEKQAGGKVDESPAKTGTPDSGVQGAESGAVG